VSDVTSFNEPAEAEPPRSTGGRFVGPAHPLDHDRPWWRRFGRRTPAPGGLTAFVLAGGGSRGAAQVGMLTELVNRGIRADRVYGASVGAVNGAAYCGQPTASGMARLVDIWNELSGDKVFPRGRAQGPWTFFQQRVAVHSNAGLRQIIETGITFDNLEDAVVPIEVVTASLSDGTERWISSGSAAEAVLASAAIPAIFPPVVIDGDLLVDGGVVNNVPLSRAIEAGATRIYVLLCGPLGFHPPTPKRPIEAMLTAFYASIHARFTRDLAALPPGVEAIVFSGRSDPGGGDYRDFSASAELIEEGREEVARVLDAPRQEPPPATEDQVRTPVLDVGPTTSS
jgi:NTE family protein